MTAAAAAPRADFTLPPELLKESRAIMRATRLYMKTGNNSRKTAIRGRIKRISEKLDILKTVAAASLQARALKELIPEPQPTPPRFRRSYAFDAWLEGLALGRRRKRGPG